MIQTQSPFNSAITDQTLDICSLVRLGIRSRVTKDEVISFGNRVVKELDQRKGSWGFLDHLREFFQKCVHLIWDHQFVSDEDFVRNFIISKIAAENLAEGPLKAWIQQSPLLHQKKAEDTIIKPRDRTKFCGIETLKHNQRDSLEQMRVYDRKKEYIKYRDKGMHYDWWSFPVEKDSTRYGKAFALTPEESNTLQQDEEFIKDLREAAILVTKAWGFDLEKGVMIANPVKGQGWSGYEVRLGKMAESLSLFHQLDLLDHLREFVRVNRIPLDPWLAKYLS